jgi:hypothetical protein
MIWAEILEFGRRLYCCRRLILLSLVLYPYPAANLHLQTSEQPFLYYLLWLFVAIFRIIITTSYLFSTRQQKSLLNNETLHHEIMMVESEYVDYNGLVELARRTATEHAKEWIPKLCEALKRENPEMSKEDIRETVANDCRDFWSRATISKFIPDEYKDPQKQEAGKKGRKKQLEKPIPAGMVRAEDSSVSQTEQESESFDRPRQDVGVGKVMYEKLQRQFKSKDDIIKQQSQEIQKLKELIDSQTMDDIPQLVDNKIGPVKVQNLAKVSEFDRRGFQILTSRVGEVIRRKLVSEGKAGVKFYMLAKDRTTGIESIVPVMFTMDMHNRSIELKLDESRL